MIERLGPQIDTPDTRATAAEQLRKSRLEAVKKAGGCVAIGTIVAGAGAMSFGQGIVQEVGIGIFLASALTPAVLMAKDAVIDIVHTYQGKNLPK